MPTNLHSVSSLGRWLGLLGLLSSLLGCATRVSVQSVGSADGSAVYELRGQTLGSLHGQAQALCPKGYAVLRQWRHEQATDPQAGLPAKAWMYVSDVLSPHATDEAQLAVQCAASPPPGSHMAL
jgi:hypothetical protein